jgi:hypothetical protein
MRKRGYNCGENDTTKLLPWQTLARQHLMSPLNRIYESFLRSQTTVNAIAHLFSSATIPINLSPCRPEVSELSGLD